MQAPDIFADRMQRMILVTGGAGFIGSHLCEALLAAGWRVRCFDNLSTSRRENVEHLLGHSGFELVIGDILSSDDVRKAMAGIDHVAHLAALGSVPRSIIAPLLSNAINASGFLQVIEQARLAGVKRFVYASSSSVYGDSVELPKREDRIGRPLSPYAVGKRTNELYGEVYHGLHGMETIGLRFFNVFGERQDPDGPYAAVIPRFIKALMAHRSPVIFGDGLQSRDFTYVGNTVQAIMGALSTTEPAAFGAVMNVACGEHTSLNALCSTLKEVMSTADPAIAAIEPEHAPARQGDIRDSLADISRAGRLLGYKPMIGVREGLQRTVSWGLAHWG